MLVPPYFVICHMIGKTAILIGYQPQRNVFSYLGEQKKLLSLNTWEGDEIDDLPLWCSRLMLTKGLDRATVPEYEC